MVTIAGAATDTGSDWVTWLLGGIAVWLVAGIGVALLVGRGISLADRMAEGADRVAEGADPAAELARPALRANAPALRATARTSAHSRRALPLPPIGIALIVIALSLETSGYLLRLTGASGPQAQWFSMDAPLSVPRMYIAALFAAAALLAVAGAGRIPERRSWWLAIGLVSGGIAVVKAGSTLHADALTELETAVGAPVALALSVSAAAVVLAGLWYLSRTDRRDRRRIIGALVLYAAASVGLSAASGAVAPGWYGAATFVEESVEALAGVALLVAVLAGVAPRLVLPVSWVLRRAADGHTLEVREGLPGEPGWPGSVPVHRGG